jgi:DNA-binding CsgD family transcriptional regulator
MVRLIADGVELVLLSPRETEVLRLAVEGHANKEIAYRLGIQECTVKKAITHMLEGLGFGNRVMLAAWAITRPQVFDRHAVSTEAYRVPTREMRRAAVEPLPLAS